MGMGGYGGMNQPMRMGMNMGMGINMGMGKEEANKCNNKLNCLLPVITP